MNNNEVQHVSSNMIACPRVQLAMATSCNGTVSN
jgi:hypothetical protein